MHQDILDAPQKAIENSNVLARRLTRNGLDDFFDYFKDKCLKEIVGRLENDAEMQSKTSQNPNLASITRQLKAMVMN